MEQKIPSFRGDKFFLSNFYPCQVNWDGWVWASSEHAYQAAKNFSDEYRKSVQACATPAQTKKLGKAAILRPDWNNVKLLIMEEILRAKFSIPELKAMLIATGDEELVELNNWHDTFYGVCNSKGENHLGKLLMKLRSEFNAGI